MTPTKPVSGVGKVAAETPPDRDRAVDVARLAALVVVMFGHCALLLATIDDTGLRIGNLLGELPAITPITWFVQVMPLFFLAGGAAGAYGWHRGSSWGTWLFKRAQRLCRPVFWYLAAWSVGILVTTGLLGADSAVSIGRESVALLWFLGVYLVVLAALGPYEVSLVVTGTERISNVSPPTLLLALHCTWMSFVFVAAAGAIGRWAQRPRVWYVVATGNGGAMTLYLWHIPAIAVATFALHAVGLDAYSVDAQWFWALLALRAVVFTVVMLAMFLMLSPLEHRRLPWWDAPVAATGTRSAAAGVLVVLAGVALVLLAKNGLGDLRGQVILGCFIAAAGAARICAGSNRVSEQSVTA